MLHMRKIISTIITVFSVYGVMSGNSVLTNQRILMLQQIEDLPKLNICANLTECVFIGDEFEVKICTHDSVTSVVFPTRRYDFMAGNDSSLLVCEETRDAKIVYKDGVPMSIDELSGFDHAPVAAFGRYRQNMYICADQTVTAHTPSSVKLITSTGDTLTNVRYDHIQRTTRFALCADSTLTIENIPDSLIIRSTADTYCITAPDEDFPRLIKSTSNISGINISFTDSTTYALTSTPVKQSQRKRRVMPQDRHFSPGSEDGAKIAISEDGSSVIVTPTAHGGELSLIISDIAGRIFLSEKINGNDQSTVNISSLPSGEYLIQVIATEEASSSVTKYIKP